MLVSAFLLSCGVLAGAVNQVPEPVSVPAPVPAPVPVPVPAPGIVPAPSDIGDSCMYVCGRARNATDPYPCNCDDGCGAENDCCDDYEDVCSGDEDETEASGETPSDSDRLLISWPQGVVYPRNVTYLAWHPVANFVRVILHKDSWNFPRYLTIVATEDYVWIVADGLLPGDDYFLEIRTLSEQLELLTDQTPSFEIGALCEIEDCTNGAPCLQGVCDCDTGFSGLLCELDQCDLIMCAHGSLCNGGECQCIDNWSGQNCHQPIGCDACEHGYFNDTCLCNCHNYWSGNACNTCEQDQNGLVCENSGTLNSKCSRCQCENGFGGNDCSIGALVCKFVLDIEFHTILDGVENSEGIDEISEDDEMWQNIDQNFLQSLESDLKEALEIIEDEPRFRIIKFSRGSTEVTLKLFASDGQTAQELFDKLGALISDPSSVFYFGIVTETTDSSQPLADITNVEVIATEEEECADPSECEPPDEDIGWWVWFLVAVGCVILIIVLIIAYRHCALPPKRRFPHVRGNELSALQITQKGTPPGQGNVDPGTEPPPPHPWKIYFNDDGSKYYYNNVTDVTSYVYPTE